MVLPAGPVERFVPVVAAAAGRAAAWKKRTRIETLLWCWIGRIVGFFSFSAGKQDLYILPIVASVAALGGLAIERGLRRRGRRWCPRTLAATGALLAICGRGGARPVRDGGARLRAGRGALVGALGLTGGLLAFGLGPGHRPGAALCGLSPRHRGELGVRGARAPGLRAIQTSAGVQPRPAGAARARRPRRGLSGRHSQPGVLPAAPC